MRPMTTSRTPRRLRPLWAGMVTCVVAVGWVSGASASPGYPGQIMDYLEKTQTAEKGIPACPPTCLLCHYSPNGEAETVRLEGFVVSLQTVADVERVKMGNDSPIEKALLALETKPCAATPGVTTPCDSDSDMAEDMAEVRAGTDPNGPGELSDCPKYGCGASSVAPGRTATRNLDGTLSLGALGLLVLLVRRRRSAAA